MPRKKLKKRKMQVPTKVKAQLKGMVHKLCAEMGKGESGQHRKPPGDGKVVRPGSRTLSPSPDVYFLQAVETRKKLDKIENLLEKLAMRNNG